MHALLHTGPVLYVGVWVVEFRLEGWGLEFEIWGWGLEFGI